MNAHLQFSLYEQNDSISSRFRVLILSFFRLLLLFVLHLNLLSSSYYLFLRTICHGLRKIRLALLEGCFFTIGLMTTCLKSNLGVLPSFISLFFFNLLLPPISLFVVCIFAKKLIRRHFFNIQGFLQIIWILFFIVSPLHELQITIYIQVGIFTFSSLFWFQSLASIF